MVPAASARLLRRSCCRDCSQRWTFVFDTRSRAADLAAAMALQRKLADLRQQGFLPPPPVPARVVPRRLGKRRPLAVACRGLVACRRFVVCRFFVAGTHARSPFGHGWLRIALTIRNYPYIYIPVKRRGRFFPEFRRAATGAHVLSACAARGCGRRKKIGKSRGSTAGIAGRSTAGHASAKKTRCNPLAGKDLRISDLFDGPADQHCSATLTNSMAMQLREICYTNGN